MREQNKFSWHSRAKSFSFATAGIVAFFKTQHNAWLHLAASVIVITAGIFFHISLTEWCLLILCIGFVFAAEFINTGIEWLTDLVSPHYHPLAGKVKDVAAGAVLVAAISSVAVGLIIFLPKIIALFN